jgi:hypothetical protein
MLSIRFETMPSAPSRHAWADTAGPPSALCSLSSMPALVSMLPSLSQAKSFTHRCNSLRVGRLRLR